MDDLKSLQARHRAASDAYANTQKQYPKDQDMQAKSKQAMIKAGADYQRALEEDARKRKGAQPNTGGIMDLLGGR